MVAVVDKLLLWWFIGSLLPTINLPTHHIMYVDVFMRLLLLLTILLRGWWDHVVDISSVLVVNYLLHSRVIYRWPVNWVWRTVNILHTQHVIYVCGWSDPIHLILPTDPLAWYMPTLSDNLVVWFVDIVWFIYPYSVNILLDWIVIILVIFGYPLGNLRVNVKLLIVLNVLKMPIMH